jgi:hypothetical protein
VLIKIDNGVPVGSAITEDNFRYLFPAQSFPLVLVNAIVEPLGYGMYNFSQVPACTAIQKVVEVAPVKDMNGVWVQQWQVAELIGVELELRLVQIEDARV